jgi:hypothetical protein
MMIIEVTDIRDAEKHSRISKSSTCFKAAIISRMAKMGQPILPKMPLPSTDSEDTEVKMLVYTDIFIVNYKCMRNYGTCFYIYIFYVSYALYYIVKLAI